MYQSSTNNPAKSHADTQHASLRFGWALQRESRSHPMVTELRSRIAGRAPARSGRPSRKRHQSKQRSLQGRTAHTVSLVCMTTLRRMSFFQARSNSVTSEGRGVGNQSVAGGTRAHTTPPFAASGTTSVDFSAGSRLWKHRADAKTEGRKEDGRGKGGLAGHHGR